MAKRVRQLHPEMFPALLREIPDSPELLYVQGELPPDEHLYLCVVGSRKASAYGKDVCRTLVESLRGYPIVIVSGLALGIDATAHEAALDADLTTIAIPGSGLGREVLYPRTNYRLAEQILEKGGALLSEFPEDYRARPESFPQRNRIMAGISHAVLVIEAEERSGTLITARLATEYNRDVLTVPGSIFSSMSAGPHMLIRLGAIPVRDGDDILEALGIEKGANTPLNISESLSENEQKVLSLLAEPQSRDTLLEKLNIPTQQVNVLLSAMELRGLITESMGKIRRV